MDFFFHSGFRDRVAEKKPPNKKYHNEFNHQRSSKLHTQFMLKKFLKHDGSMLKFTRDVQSISRVLKRMKPAVKFYRRIKKWQAK